MHGLCIKACLKRLNFMQDDRRSYLPYSASTNKTATFTCLYALYREFRRTSDAIKLKAEKCTALLSLFGN